MIDVPIHATILNFLKGECRNHFAFACQYQFQGLTVHRSPVRTLPPD